MKKYLLLFPVLCFLLLTSCTEEDNGNPDNTPVGEIDPALVGLWTRYRLETYTAGGYTGGYFRQEYSFNADGTYQYLLKHYSVFSTPIIFLYERGNWGVNDNQLTIKPTKGQDQEWSKVDGNTTSWGSKLSTSTRTLETITYTYGGKYWEGTNTIDLAMSYTRETVRDGSFSDSSLQAWYYQSRDESLINLPPGFSW